MIWAEMWGSRAWRRHGVDMGVGEDVVSGEFGVQGCGRNGRLTLYSYGSLGRVCLRRWSWMVWGAVCAAAAAASVLRASSVRIMSPTLCALLSLKLLLWSRWQAHPLPLGPILDAIRAVHPRPLSSVSCVLVCPLDLSSSPLVRLPVVGSIFFLAPRLRPAASQHPLSKCRIDASTASTSTSPRATGHARRPDTLLTHRANKKQVPAETDAARPTTA